MKMFLPTGMPFYYKLNNNAKFDFEFAGDESGWSKNALDWLSFMAWDVRFKRNATEKYTLQCAVTGEKQIKVDGRYYRVDGYVETASKIYILEFFGCFFHSCPLCKVTPKEDTTVKDQEKIKSLSKIGEVIVMRECQWRQLRRNCSWESPFSKFFMSKNIAPGEIISAVERGDFFGLLEIDLTTPEHVRSRFRQINFGTIFNRLAVTEPMLSEKMKNALPIKKFPLAPQLTLVFEAEKYLVTSETLKFYIELGLIVTKVHSCIEFQRARPLDKFITKGMRNFYLLIFIFTSVTEKRIEATRNNQKAMINCYKLVGNSCYGRLGESEFNFLRLIMI